MIDPKADPMRHAYTMIQRLGEFMEGDFETEEEQAARAQELLDLCYKSMTELTIENAMEPKT